MRLTGIALGRLRRGKARATLVVTGLALGVATAVALADVTGALEHQLGEEIDRHGANIVVAPRTEGLEVSYGGLAVVGAILIGTLGALSPAWKASKLDPTEALRHV